MTTTDAPRTTVVAMLCQWCSYSASDAAGAAKLALPPNLRVMQVPCSGRVDPGLVVHAFEQGADGVLVAGCHPGDCHYGEGNYQALGRIELLRSLLGDLGVAPARLRLEWISAQEGQRYAAVARAVAGEIEALGPLDWPRRPLRAAPSGGPRG